MEVVTETPSVPVYKIRASDMEEKDRETGMEKYLEMPAPVVEMCKTIKNMADDFSADVIIPLYNVETEQVKLVIEYCVHHAEHPEYEEIVYSEEQTQKNQNIVAWDVEFFDRIGPKDVPYLLTTANYLDCKRLLKASAIYIASKIRGRRPEEIRETFGIKNDFSPEEERRVRKENGWIEDETTPTGARKPPKELVAPVVAEDTTSTTTTTSDAMVVVQEEGLVDESRDTPSM